VSAAASIAWRPRPDAGEGPLAGVRVLDFSELLPGPFLSQCMVELGAEVIKVERPPHGDPTRRVSPGLFTAVNRGKRSWLADLKDPAARAPVLALADEADVLLAQFRPGVIDRLGFGAAAMRARNPRLIHVCLSGFGSGGPRADWPGHDINYLAVAGVAALAGTDADPTPRPGVPMADLGASVYGLAAVNAALFQRERTGRGQHLDIAITDCAAHWMNPRWAVIHQRGATTLAAQRAVAQQRPAYGVFRCRDGRLLSVAALETHFWQRLARALALPQAGDPAWDDPQRRAQGAADLNDALQAALSRCDAESALARLIAADVPAALVADPADVSADPQFMARALFIDTAAGPLARFPVAMQGRTAPPPDAPALGAG